MLKESKKGGRLSATTTPMCQAREQMCVEGFGSGKGAYVCRYYGDVVTAMILLQEKKKQRKG